jgi:hypothetical protein
MDSFSRRNLFSVSTINPVCQAAMTARNANVTPHRGSACKGF